MRRRGTPVVALWVAAVTIAAAGCSSDATVTTADDLSEEFAARVEQFSRASIGYEERITRVAGETSFEVASVTVLVAFPEKVTVGDRQITGRVDGHSIGCNDATGTMECVDNGEIDVAGEAEQSIEKLLDGLVGESPQWWVTEGQIEDCYQLTAVRSVLAARWGDRAVVCFDPVSSLMTSETIDVEGGRDTIERALVRGSVDHSDLLAALPATG